MERLCSISNGVQGSRKRVGMGKLWYIPGVPDTWDSDMEEGQGYGAECEGVEKGKLREDELKGAKRKERLEFGRAARNGTGGVYNCGELPNSPRPVISFEKRSVAMSAVCSYVCDVQQYPTCTLTSGLRSRVFSMQPHV